MPFASFLTTTVALGTTAFCGSRTKPEIAALSDCASAPAQKRITPINTRYGARNINPPFSAYGSAAERRQNWIGLKSGWAELVATTDTRMDGSYPRRRIRILIRSP